MTMALAEFDRDDALEHGLLPVVAAAPVPRDVLSAYATLYLEHEVKAEGLVRSVGSFARFLEVVSFAHSGILNVSNIARESQVNRKTVEGYLEILQDLLLSHRLPAFTKRAVRQTTSHPKFFLFDTGVFRALRPKGPLDRPEEIGGAALEGLVSTCAHGSATARATSR